jgi:hypothetical protein
MPAAFGAGLRIAIASFMKICFHETMTQIGETHEDPDENLQVQIPASTKRSLGHRSVETREPVRMIVLRALKEYGLPVPDEAIWDRRRRRSS